MSAAEVVVFQHGVTDRPEQSRFKRAVGESRSPSGALAFLMSEYREHGVDLSHLGSRADIEAYLAGGLQDAVDDGAIYGDLVDVPTAKVISIDEARQWGLAIPAPSRLTGSASRLSEKFSPPAQQEYLIGTPDDAFLPAHLRAALVGPGSVGKSQLIVQLAVALALGIPFLGCPVPVGGKKTVIVTGEDDAEDFNRKFYSVIEAMGLGDAEWNRVRDCVVLLPVIGKGATFIEAARGGTFTTAPGVDDLAAEIASLCPDPDLIVCDTLSTLLHAGEEAAPVAAFWEAVDHLSKKFKSEPAVLVAHHVSKEVAGRGAHGQDIGRGSSAFGSSARTVITMANVVEGSSGNIAEVDKLLGEGGAPRHRIGDLRLVHVAKVKGSKSRARRVVETVSAPSGLGFIFKVYALPLVDKQRAKAEQWAKSVAFRDLIEEVTAETGNPVTANALEQKGVESRSRAAIKEHIKQAVKLGLVLQEKRTNGKGTLVKPLYPDRPVPVDAQQQLTVTNPAVEEVQS